ncbi:ParB-like nuclease domain protein [Hartmannibacter diazotrophicus]|uniref:ParB-like nuclease domain protein n=1 Tax=Hartmannibacter diazotrophicus TaxID=1482074 RepID=A0A2C9D0D9_9HYPH|nr:ParB N-terminal domain-containing protein [Hartmannibacter diazotrophicus]SON53704.1 ParB-like nuclease domain protein [Hartmannibacter diazotrophicus]
MRDAGSKRQKALQRLRKAALGRSREDRPSAVFLQEITVCPEVFQPRVLGSENGLDDKHIEALVAALESKPANARELDPITVFAVGKRFYVIDGHHRHAAYAQAGVIGTVPVVHFDGSFEEALSEPLRINGKVHLNMSREARNGAAWRLVVEGIRGDGPKLSVPKIAEIAGLSPRTIDRMRALCRELMADEEDGGEEESTGEGSMGSVFRHLEEVWEDHRAALRAARGGEAGPGDGDWIEATADKWSDDLGRAFGHQGHKHPGIFGRAVLRYLGDHNFKRMTEEVGFVEMDPEEHERFLEWQNKHATLTGH